MQSHLQSHCLKRRVNHLLESSIRRRKNPAPFCIEPLEQRLMLSASLPPALVVGRTLSSYTTSGVTNHQETITYTIYNEQADTLTGVLLTDTLQSGITFSSASAQPDQSGQQLAWSLGSIAGFDRASVTLTVALPNSTPLTLDTGAAAFATLNAAAVTNSTPAITLRTDSPAANLLASTPDANTTDPFVQEEAAKLSYDPQQIFGFLHTQISYNSYTGSVRGARGTLWSSAGNSLDVASLGVALMRAAGIPAQYVSGALAQNQAQQLILSMFPTQYQTVGYIPNGTTTADPANDSQLLAETESHNWFQFDPGTGMQDADPLMAGASIGQTFTSSTGTFTEVADNLREKTTIQLNAEIYNTASSLFGGLGGGTSTTTVLSQTFNDVDLVGHPLTLGNFTSTNSVGSLFSVVTNTYSPYLRLGDDAFDAGQDQLIRGQDFQEVLTNFPFGSQILTGLFLNVTLSGPQGPSETAQETLVDRIGYAAREGLAQPNVSIDPSGPPAISPLDLYTVSLLPGGRGPETEAGPGVVGNAVANLDAFGAQFASASAQEQANLTPQAIDAFRDIVIAAERSRLAVFEAESTGAITALAKTTQTVAYLTRPRITIASAKIQTLGDGSTQLQFGIDLARSDYRILLAPGQAPAAKIAFNVDRGFTENIIEGSLLTPPTGAATPLLSFAVYTTAIFDAAKTQGIPLTTLLPDDPAALDQFQFSADVKARISDALAAGLVVVVPTRNVAINGQPVIGWFQINQTTGEAVGVLQNGTHGLVEEAFEYELEHYETANPAFRFAAGYIVGFFQGGVLKNLAIAPIISAIPIASQISTIKNYITAWFNAAQLAEDQLIRALAAKDPFFAAGLAAGFAAAFKLTADPPLPPILINPQPFTKSSVAENSLDVTTPDLTAGAVSLNLQSNSLQVLGQIAASWTNHSSSSFVATNLNSSTATIHDAMGNLIGTGPISLTTTVGTAVAVGGDVQYAVSGQGNLAFYGPSSVQLGTGADWDSYSANLSGTNMVLTLTTGGLMLNGTLLPLATYTIATAAASLSGSGRSTSPNFAGSATINTTNATVYLGASQPQLVTIGGTQVDPTNGITLAGYAGSITIVPGSSFLALTASGTAGQVLTADGGLSITTTDQNHSVTLTPNVHTSAAGTYQTTVTAPTGWTSTTDQSGNVIVTPAPGLQSGTYQVMVAASLLSDPTFVAQGIVNVNVGATSPGVSLAVSPDTLLTVPFSGAQVPTAFQARIDNTGPVADTFNLSFTNLPAGFTLLSSDTSITIPAGQTGVVGIYLQPTGTLPAPGTQLSFTVTATSAGNSSITQSQTETFTMPAIDAVTITANPTAVSTVPGGSTTSILTITNAGNIAENGITLTDTASSGLVVTGLAPVSLSIGQSTTETVTLAPNASTPLNTTLDTAIIATYGSTPQTTTVDLPVRVVIPGADALANAATAANTLGRTDLANRLNDLSTALTNLVQNPTDPIAKGQTLASITALIAQFNGDAFLTALTPNFTTADTAITNATSANDVQSAATALSNALASLNTTLTDEAAHSFTLSFVNNSQIAQPQVGTPFQLVLQNTGTATTTYDLSISGLPSGVTAAFSQPSITLDPGQVSPGSSGVPDLFVTLTSTSTTDLPAFNFTVTARAHDATEISESATGSLAARAALIQVASVTPSPTFTNPGGQVDVSAKILNAVNKQQQAKVSYVVKDASNTVLFTSTPVTTTLNVLTTLTTVDLGSFDTTGFATGQDTITVTVTDTNNTPIPGATGTGSLLIGTPVTATLSTTPTTLPPGSGTVTSTLQLDSQNSLAAPITVEGQAAISGASSVAINGNIAYVGIAGGIDVVDISDPTHPTVLSTFGTSDVPGGESVNALKITGNELVAQAFHNTPSTLLVYSITNPTTPILLGQTPLTFSSNQYSYLGGFTISNNHVYTLAAWYRYTPGPNTIFAQFGESLDVDISNPAAPTVVNVIYNDPPDSSTGFPDGTSNVWQSARINNNVLLTATTSATGSTVNGSSVQGQVMVVDTTDPANPSVLEKLAIPGMAVVTGISVVGNQAFVVGSSQNWITGVSGFGGAVVVANLDVTNPQSPTIVSTQALNVRSIGASLIESLGNHLFVTGSLGGASNAPQLLVFDDTNPSNVVVSQVTAPANANNFTASGNLLLTSDGSNLLAYNIGTPQEIPVVAQVTVPTNNGVSIVPNSFNIAPTSTTTGANSETLTWDLGFSNGNTSATITWQSAATGLQPAQSLPITQGATVQFTASGTPGTLTLPGTSVAGDQIIGLSPATQTTAPGAPAHYTVTLSNPTTSAVTYTLSIQGLPAAWSTLQSSVMVAANGSVDVPLTITSDSFASLNDDSFTVSASGDNGAASSVLGDLILAGTAAAIEPQSHGIVVSLAPTSATAGQGTSANYTVQLTNTGSADESFTLVAGALPTGITASFGQTTIDVPPGASNFRDVPLTLTTQSGTTPASVPFTVTATSTTVSSNTSTAAGTLIVAANGVHLSLDKTSGAPGDTFQLTITNTGAVADTYDISLAGPAALAASLSDNLVILDPGASQLLTITTISINFADPGALALTAIATSRGNTAVISSATAALTVPTTSGLSTGFAPDTQILPIPGTTSFLLTVHNTGNTEDSFTAAITGTTGSITSTLTGIDGQPTQAIPVFHLPGLATGQFILYADATATGHSTIAVQVTSLSNSTVTSANTATVEAGSTTPIVTLYSSAILSEAGQPIAFTAVVCIPGTGAPGTGTVTFMDGSAVLGTTALDANGAAAFTTSTLAVGNHTITAAYSGGGILAATASNAVVESINPSGPISGTPDERFVGSLYRDILHRAAAPSEVAVWIADLNAGATRQQVALGFENSPEQRTIEVNQFYSNFLHRSPDPNASYWLNAFLSGWTDEQVEIGFLTSGEYEANHPLLTPDIDAQYNDILLRCGDPSGRTHWINTLTTNTPDQRPQVALDFLYSTESVANIVNTQYAAFLRRTPDPTGFDHFSSELQAGIADPTDTAAEILGSQEYFNDATTVT
jgi:uncharacterized repeat protein (TIGR01451 family)